VKQGLWHRLDIVARSLSPLAITLLLIMLGMVPLQIPEVYYWAVHRPNLMTVWVIFLVGLFQDLLSGGHLGVGILALLMVHVVIDTQRRIFARSSFQALWVLFAIVAAAALYLMWLLNCLLQGVFLEVQPVLFQYLTTVAAYPCLAWLFAQAQKAFLK
jgi:rod shape-determining protein MreD